MAGGSESGSGGSSGSGKVRSVELVRRAGSKLGFSVRGGREHATGFFVTAVEPQSEAHSQGLRAGDQIIRVNGFPVEDATHSELLQLIQAHTSLLLKVRRVGMIPEKEEGSDELRWRIVEPESFFTIDPDQLAQHNELVEQLARHNELAEQLARQSEVPLVLKVPAKAKLGCGICKGPDWKPGIFVQFTKENSIARAGGLRPGDQILQCNNVLFTPDMPFNEAVSIMRSCGMLKLVVRKGAGLELFPGESSGYNSSASSVAGDHPVSSWTNTTPEPDSRPVEEIEAEKLGCVEPLSISNSRKQHVETACGGNNNIKDTGFGGSTIVQVGSDHQPLSNGKLAEICMVSQQMETKTTTVLVEVHHSEEDSLSNSQSDENTERLTSSSVSSNASSLRRAISQELERRSKRAAPPTTEKLIKSGLTKEEMHQHEQLMHEFRQAHHKMFADISKVRRDDVCNEDTLGEQKAAGRVACKIQPDMVTKAESKAKVESKAKTECKVKPDCKAKLRDDSIRHRHRKHPAPQPPPPPPMPCGEELKPKKGQAPPPPCRPPESPPCPTPDYDTLSLASDSHQSCDKVDMQSLESFRLTNPTSQKPKPPNTYFPKSSSGSSQSTASTVVVRDGRPLVTIREYGEGSRPQVSKLDLLQQQSLPSDLSDQPLQHRLATELCHTLSRSNLSTNNHQAINSKGIHESKAVSGGSVIKICVDNDKNKTDRGKPAPFYLFPEYRRTGVQQNNVSFNLSGKQTGPLQSHPNGILKNSNISHVQIHSSHHDKPLPLKTIKFGAITTVMRDSPEPKA